MIDKVDDGFSALELRVSLDQISITDDYNNSQILMTLKCWNELKDAVDEKLKELDCE